MTHLESLMKTFSKQQLAESWIAEAQRTVSYAAEIERLRHLYNETAKQVARLEEVAAEMTAEMQRRGWTAVERASEIKRLTQRVAELEAVEAWLANEFCKAKGRAQGSPIRHLLLDVYGGVSFEDAVRRRMADAPAAVRGDER